MPLRQVQILILVFAVVAGWGALNHRRAGSLQKQVASISAERDRAQEAAQACSASVQQLQELAARREKEAAKERAAAHARARLHQRRADAQLARPAAVPGDDYASARLRVDAWLAQRGQ